jgi:hypothetical protein
MIDLTNGLFDMSSAATKNSVADETLAVLENLAG